MKRTKTTLKSYFETGDKPKQFQYENLIDSLRHLDDKIPSTDIDGQVALKDQINHFTVEQGFGHIYVGGEATFDDATSFNSPVEFSDTSHFQSNIGMGKQPSSWMLDVTHPQGDLIAKFGDLNSSHLGVVINADTNGGWLGNDTIVSGEGLYYQNSTNSIRIYTNSTEAARFSSNQNLLIGQTADTGQKLQVNGDAIFTGLVTLNSGIETSSIISNGHITANAGMSSNSHIKLKNNGWLWSQYSSAHDELRLNANTTGGWDFYNQTQTSFADIRAKDAEFNGLITANTGIRVNQILNTPANTDLKIVPHGTGNIHFGNSADGNKLFHYSNLNDGKYTTFSHNSTQSIFDTTHANGFLFEKKVIVNGDIQPSGNYVSSDGTPGYNGNFTVGVYDITVKDGLITNVVNIS